MRDITFDNVKSFTVAELRLRRTKVTEASALAHDLGVAGLDGKEFMDAYASRFSVDLGVFDWVEYFGPEVAGNPFGLISYLYKRFVQGIAARELIGTPEITLGHLVHCANLGKWQPPAQF